MTIDVNILRVLNGEKVNEKVFAKIPSQEAQHAATTVIISYASSRHIAPKGLKDRGLTRATCFVTINRR